MYVRAELIVKPLKLAHIGGGAINESRPIARIDRNVRGNYIERIREAEAVQGLLQVAFRVVNVDGTASRSTGIRLCHQE